MDSYWFNRLMADAILVVHFLYILFVVIGLLLVFIGGIINWHWIRNFWFRIVHLSGIAIVVFQSWLGLICPLTIWESYFRRKAGLDPLYDDSFIRYWLHKLIYFNAESWLFVLIYTVFGLFVLISWIAFPPKKLLKD